MVEGGFEFRGVRKIGYGSGHGVRLEIRFGDIKDKLHPFIFGIGPDTDRIDFPIEFNLLSQVGLQPLKEIVMGQCGYRSNINADRREIGHGIDIETSGEGPDIEGGRAQYRVRWHTELEAFEGERCTGRLVNGVYALIRHGAMGRNASSPGLQEDGPFVTDNGIIGTGFPYHQGPRLSQLPTLRTQVSRSLAALLLPGGEHQSDPALARQKGR